MVKILIINPSIANYRIPIFNEIGKKYNVKVLHGGDEINGSKVNFSQQIIHQKKIGPFSVTPVNLHKICNEYDVVISEGNIRYLDRDLLAINKFRSYKWIFWGIGVSASYDKNFDEDQEFDFIRHFIFKCADANIFYSEYPISKYIKAGFDKSSLFVAHNTTEVSFNKDEWYEKDKLLFVGSLYKQKRIYELLEAYKIALGETHNGLPLYIIGEGKEYSNINTWIQSNNLENSIKLKGAIYNQDILERYFRSALACISPGQAGLSVLTSMGYGTPFITKINAITGGEIFNIKDQETGILYEHKNELPEILIDIFKNRQKYIDMGVKARKFYIQNRRPEQMVGALVSAIEFVL